MDQQSDGLGSGQPRRGVRARWILVGLAGIAAIALIIGLSVGLRKGGAGKGDSSGTNDSGTGILNFPSRPTVGQVRNVLWVYAQVSVFLAESLSTSDSKTRTCYSWYFTPCY